ncbi:hypothetical protein VP01_1612g3 [Puccinia sorghi]|uniref:Uncharacterized protein n=1 Tax=Puccinia sorghi TaxID=27349 RepID=A0A0L6VIY4_9BASI|nr:hypothetical protein VP01_1612g3 [Puccinia sorghi]
MTYLTKNNMRLSMSLIFHNHFQKKVRPFEALITKLCLPQNLNLAKINNQFLQIPRPLGALIQRFCVHRIGKVEAYSIIQLHLLVHFCKIYHAQNLAAHQCDIIFFIKQKCRNWYAEPQTGHVIWSADSQNGPLESDLQLQSCSWGTVGETYHWIMGPALSGEKSAQVALHAYDHMAVSLPRLFPSKTCRPVVILHSMPRTAYKIKDIPLLHKSSGRLNTRPLRKGNASEKCGMMSHHGRGVGHHRGCECELMRWPWRSIAAGCLLYINNMSLQLSGKCKAARQRSKELNTDSELEVELSLSRHAMYDRKDTINASLLRPTRSNFTSEKTFPIKHNGLMDSKFMAEFLATYTLEAMVVLDRRVWRRASRHGYKNYPPQCPSSSRSLSHFLSLPTRYQIFSQNSFKKLQIEKVYPLQYSSASPHTPYKTLLENVVQVPSGAYCFGSSCDRR